MDSTRFQCWIQPDFLVVFQLGKIHIPKLGPQAVPSLAIFSLCSLSFRTSYMSLIYGLDNLHFPQPLTVCMQILRAIKVNLGLEPEEDYEVFYHIEQKFHHLMLSLLLL